MQWFHWFDLLIILVGGLGVFLGRHGPASGQIIGFIRWLFVLLICSIVYHQPTLWIAPLLGMRPDILALILYAVSVPAVYLALGFAWRATYGRALKMEWFGNNDHHVSKLAGMLRTLTILFVVMAWINGRYVTEADLHDYEVFCQENFGSIRWPVLSTVQEDVFEAHSGKFARQYLNALLVTPLPPPPELVRAEAERKAQLAKAKIPVIQKDAPEGADAIIDELENGRGKKRKGARGRDVEAPVADEASAVPTEATLQIIYKQLSLKGISGTGDKRLALINNQTLKAGESQLVKVQGQKVKVFCKEIRESSVVIQVDDKGELMELLLGGQVTNILKSAASK